MSQARTPERHSSLAALPRILDALGSRRALLVTGGSARFSERVRELAGERIVEVFAGARRHVPEAVLEEARAMLARTAADTIVALGGGAAIGLGKALKLDHPLGFIAIPTTYSGSELTDIFGITRAHDKRTGRDPKVRPEHVIHDVELTLAMPKALTVTSLMNALAHPIAALAAGLLPEERRDAALDAIAHLVAALEVLARSPDSRRARAEALDGAALAAASLEVGTPGLQHGLAHRLGGRFDLEHGALHALLLPHTFNRLRASAPDVVALIEARLRLPDLEATLFDLLVSAGAPTALAAMNVTRGQIDQLVAESPELPAELLMAALDGRRPSRSVRREDWGLAAPVSLRGEIAAARRVVVALHGRGATADSIVRRVLEIVGDDPEVAVVAPHAPGNVWYTRRFTAPRAELGAELDEAVGAVGKVLDRVLVHAPAERVVLFGYSQGACLASEVFAGRGQRLAALVALSGCAIGADDELTAPAPTVAGTPVILGVSDGDPWVASTRIAATARLFEAAGCAVTFLPIPGETHTLHVRHRLLARPHLRGLVDPPPPTGFGNALASEALSGALPPHGNIPRRAPYGLYPEQLNITGFTAPRAHNRRVWLYRVRPSARHGRLEALVHKTLVSDFSGRAAEPNLTGFSALPIPTAPTDFVDGLHTLGGAGSPSSRRGYAVHLYAANRNMEDRAFHDADGDLVVLPQDGALTILTELGALEVSPGEIAVIPRGLRFSVQLVGASARGWVGEVFGPGFVLPERGPVGANGLADPRHFRAPVAFHEDRLAPGYRVAMKLDGVLYEATQDTSPFDVAAWHGNAVPFVYDLKHFSPVMNGRFDHIDPSAHTVISAPLDEPGHNALDLVAFVPRWDLSEGTFRPPYFHRNVTTELNGIIREHASPSSPFQPGVTFLTPSLVPHGVMASAVERALGLDDASADRPSRGSDHSLWFQFESAMPLSLTPWAEDSALRIRDWHLVWGAYRTHFSTEVPPAR